MRHTVIRLLLGIISCGMAAASSMPFQAGPSNTDAATSVELTVAAANELNPALSDVARAFEKKTGDRVHLTFGDSTSLYSHIRGGEAFDAFFSADMESPRRLVASGVAAGASLTEYAHDSLVLCISPMVRLPFLPGSPLLALRDKAISHIAIADPQHTTAGKAAEEALRSAHDYDIAIRRKVLIGDDLSQVAHLMASGDADAAMIPKTAMRTYSFYGARVIPVDPSLYRPIGMASVVMTRSKHRREALAFVKFAASSQGRAIFRRDGF